MAKRLKKGGRDMKKINKKPQKSFRSLQAFTSICNCEIECRKAAGTTPGLEYARIHAGNFGARMN